MNADTVTLETLLSILTLQPNVKLSVFMRIDDGDTFRQTLIYEGTPGSVKAEHSQLKVIECIPYATEVIIITEYKQ